MLYLSGSELSDMLNNRRNTRLRVTHSYRCQCPAFQASFDSASVDTNQNVVTEVNMMHLIKSCLCIGYHYTKNLTQILQEITHSANSIM